MIDVLKKVENILFQAGIEEYKPEAKLIVEEISNFSLEELLLGKEISNLDKIILIAKKRAQTKVPIQYLLNSAYFMGKKFYVDESVLIPRDETEILVRCAVDIIKTKKDKINLLDIGIGSGIIPISVLKNSKKDIEALGVDISSKALITALKNILDNNLDRKILIRKSDIFSKIRNFEKFDIIVSNPPYIPKNEKQNLQKELFFEPESALFTKDDLGVEFYQKIIDKARNYLKSDGHIIFELGINQAKLVKNMLKKDFKDIQIIKDLSGIERTIFAQIK